MMTHKALVRKMLKQPAVKVEYDAQADEFALLDELLKSAPAGWVDTSRGCSADGHENPGRGSAGGRRRQPAAFAVCGHATQVRAGRRVPVGDPAEASPAARQVSFVIQ